MRQNIRYKTVQLNGADIFYREAGSEGNPIILLLHGYPGSSFSFRNIIHELKEKYHCIAPDYPGFGYSAAQKNDKHPYSFHTLSVFIEEFMKKIKVKFFSLYAVGIGLPIAMRFLTRCPEMLDCLIIENSTIYLNKKINSVVSLQTTTLPQNTDVQVTSSNLPISSLSNCSSYVYGVSNTEMICPDIFYMNQMFLKNPEVQQMHELLETDSTNNTYLIPLWQRMLRDHQPPTLILWSKNDPFLGEEEAYGYREDLPQAQILLFASGHFLLEEYCCEVAEEVHQFLCKKSKLHHA